eukprot:248629-Pleurochrysis_carterae.AAC.1
MHRRTYTVTEIHLPVLPGDHANGDPPPEAASLPITTVPGARVKPRVNVLLACSNDHAPACAWKAVSSPSHTLPSESHVPLSPKREKMMRGVEVATLGVTSKISSKGAFL